MYYRLVLREEGGSFDISSRVICNDGRLLFLPNQPTHQKFQVNLPNVLHKCKFSNFYYINLSNGQELSAFGGFVVSVLKLRMKRSRENRWEFLLFVINECKIMAVSTQ
jgi:hypothetical protein